MYIYSKSYYYTFSCELYLLLLSMNLFVCHFLPPCEGRECIVSLHLCQFFYPSACFCAAWLFTITEKSVCDNIDPLLSVISVMGILVKPSQIICIYVTSFVMCQSVCLFVFAFERYAFHIIVVLRSHTPYFSRT